jgi:hypothetical protein
LIEVLKGREIKDMWTVGKVPLDPSSGLPKVSLAATLRTETLAGKESTEMGAMPANKPAVAKRPQDGVLSIAKSSADTSWKKGRPDRTMARFAMLFSMTRPLPARSMPSIFGAPPFDVLD